MQYDHQGGKTILKHYREQIWLKILNGIIEYGLIMGAYYLSGFFRMIMPKGLVSPFSYRDVLAFQKGAFLCALVMTVIYFLIGDYTTIHYRHIKNEMMRVFLVQLFGGFFLSAVLYWTQGQQFSRIWMVLFIAISTGFIIIKRVLFHELSDRLLGKHLVRDRLILIGGGELASRFVRGAESSRECRFEIAGYVADAESHGIKKHLGSFEELDRILRETENINLLVISEEDVEWTDIRRIINICGLYDIKAYIIPSFNDYISYRVGSEFEENIAGITLVPLNTMDTDDILGVNISITNINKAVQDISENLDRWRGEYICMSNVHTTIMAYDDPEYLKVQNSAVMSLPDGGPLSSHSRREGAAAGRVTGTDLMNEILSVSHQYGWRHFFYGASESTLEALRKKIEKDHPGAEIAGMISPPFRILTPEEDHKYLEEINSANPDILWVSLGAPKQEIWMAAHQGKINALMIGVGAAFDYESGRIKRAPLWMQKANLEWFYRLIQDPGRLFKRYLYTNTKYVWLTRK